MMLGGWNPLPMQIGGADPPARAIHLSLRAAVGKGGAGPMWDVGGIEDFWRWCKALGTWVGLAQVDAATGEYLPRTMTYHVALWEDALGLPAEGDLETRKRAVEVARYAVLSAVITDVQAYLREAFDSQITIGTTTLERMARAEAHRYLQGSKEWGEGHGSRLANFSSAFHITVLWPSLRTAAQRFALQRALLVRLPAWVTFSVVNAKVFYLDGGPDGASLLDITGLA